MKKLARHLQIFFNEQLNLDFYVTNEFHALDKNIGSKVPCENIVVNYNLKNDNNKCIQKVVLDDTIYYEINFEKAYYVDKGKFNKLEQYLLNFVKLFFEENATELITYLKSLNCLSDENLLEIESNFNFEKKKNYKKKLSEMLAVQF